MLRVVCEKRSLTINHIIYLFKIQIDVLDIVTPLYEAVRMYAL